MTTSQQNRNNAYHNHTTKVRQCDKIKSILLEKGGLTIGEMAEILCLPKSTISGRIGDLKPNVEPIGSKLDAHTNTMVTIWRWCGGQMSFFVEEKVTPVTKLREIQRICKENKCELSEKILKIIE